MKSIIQFKISESEGTYIAEGVDLAIVTEGNTINQLKENIIEATALYLDVSIEEMMLINQDGGSFDFLNDEPNLYTLADVIK